ncbi:MAG: sigma-70 family RNA polymerase sigma factor [Ktedonobacteraceae bacterium]
MQKGQDYSKSLTAFSQYMREVKWIPQLTDEEEKQSLQCLIDGVDVQRSRDRLVEGCQTMIMSLARRFARDCQHMEFLDFVQEGNIGLLQAIEKYDVRRDESSFKTLAFAWARGQMLMAYWRDERAICVPLSKVRVIRQMNVVLMNLLAFLGREPTVTEIAREMGVSERAVYELMVLQHQQFVSLQTSLDEDGETSLEDILEDTAASAFSNDGFSSVEDVLGKLTEQERSVIQLRYGLTDGCAYSQQEVARLLGVGMPIVQKLDRRAKMRLREALVA